DIVHRCDGKWLVSREPFLDDGELAGDIVAAKSRKFPFITLLVRQKDGRNGDIAARMGEVLGRDTNRVLGIGLVKRIQSDIPDYVIHPPGVAEIACDDRVPPTRLAGDACSTSDIDELSVDVPEKRDRHPLPHYDQVGLAVTVKVGKQRITYHPDVRQTGRHLGSDVSEPRVAVARVVAENMAAYWFRILPRPDAARHEKIYLSVIVHIRAPDAKFAAQTGG